MNTSGQINPKNRYCLRGLDGKYGRWDAILRDIRRDTDDDDDDGDDEEMLEDTNYLRHLRKRRTMCANTDESGRRCTTNTY